MDFLKDNNDRVLSFILENFKVPDYVGDEDMLQKQASGIPMKKIAYADPMHEEYPVNSPALVWSGYGYAAVTGNNKVLKTLKKAAALYNITSDIKQFDDYIVNKESEKIKKQAKEYAFIVKDDETNRTYGMYPISNASQVMNSSALLVKNANQHEFNDFVEICRKLVKKAKEYNLDPDGLAGRVYSFGEDREFDIDNFKDFIEARIGITKDAEIQDIYQQSLDLLIQDATKLNDIVGIVKEADHLNGIGDYTKYTDPYIAAFSGAPTSELMKIASDFVIADGNIIPRKAFSDIPDNVIDDMFAKSIAGNLKLCKTAKENSWIASYYETLENDNKEKLLSLLLQYGS